MNEQTIRERYPYRVVFRNAITGNRQVFKTASRDDAESVVAYVASEGRLIEKDYAVGEGEAMSAPTGQRVRADWWKGQCLEAERRAETAEAKLDRVRRSLETAIRLHASDDNPAARVIARDALHAMDREEGDT